MRAGDRGPCASRASYVRTLADEMVTAALAKAYPSQLQQPDRNPRMAFACTCSSGYCFKVMKVKSVQRSLQRKEEYPFGCPAHEAKDAKHSTLVTHFADIVHRDDGAAKIIWDWQCVPENGHMSIDASVFRGDRGWARFEVDGRVHFRRGQHMRTDTDIEKDRLLNKHELGMLRLHHADAELWHMYVTKHLSTAATRVSYTSSYRACLQGEPQEKDIIEAADL